MDLIGVFAFVIVVLSGLYLIGLGAAALVKPDSAKGFLAGFASTRTLHFVELSVRVLIAAALIVTASRARFSFVFSLVGWTLMITTAILLVVPWKLHRRFAQVAVPLATKRMMPIGFASCIAGILLLTSLLLGANEP